jgi:hypothetical protein
MNKTFVIQWKSKVNGRAGRGTKTFQKEEAARLADELNREYPQIEHQIIEAQPVSREHSEEPASAPVPLLSIA